MLNLPTPLNIDSCISDIVLSVEFLRQIVGDLDDNVNPGPDGIPAYFIKRCWAALEKPVFCIFEKAINSGYFPKIWKFSYILPIYKAGNKHDVANYRPISVISCLPKILDTYLANELSSALLLNNNSMVL